MSLPHRRFGSRRWLRWPGRTARVRLSALYGGLFLVAGAVLVAVTYALFRRATELAKPQLPQVPQAPSIQGLQQLLVPHALLQLSQDQKQLAHVNAQLRRVKGLASPPSPGHLLGQGGPLARLLPRLTEDQHRLATAVTQLAQAVHQMSRAASVQAAQRAADSHELLVNAGIALAIVAVLALAAGWLVAGRMLRPIRTITSTAQRISSTNLHERLALAGPKDELKELGDTLDGLFERLEAAFESQRRFVANASHELRTPLAAERTLLQVALEDPDTSAAEWRSAAEEVLASNDEQARLIEALLVLASSESGLSEREPVDLGQITSAVLAELRPDLERQSVVVRQSLGPAPTEGDPLLIERLVTNLLTNAIRHNVEQGYIEVTTETREGRAALSVTNTGPTIPPEEADRLFQPFQRLDPRRANYKDGHGLGLSIVQAIATSHGATLSAHPNAGGGLFISVTFPQEMDSDRAASVSIDGRRSKVGMATS